MRHVTHVRSRVLVALPLNYKAQTRGSCCVTPQGARAASTHKGQFAEWVPGSARARAYAQLQQEHTFSFEPPGTLSRTCVDGSGFLRNSRGPTRARAWAILSFPQFRRPPGRTCGNTPRGKSLERVYRGAHAQGNRPSVYSPVGTATSTCAGRDPPGGYCCGPRPTSTNCELLVSNEISTRVHIDQL